MEKSIKIAIPLSLDDYKWTKNCLEVLEQIIGKTKGNLAVQMKANEPELPEEDQKLIEGAPKEALKMEPWLVQYILMKGKDPIKSSFKESGNWSTVPLPISLIKVPVYSFLFNVFTAFLGGFSATLLVVASASAVRYLFSWNAGQKI
jgi:hypothetical protein